VPEDIELVIFDCDGVLIDSERLAVEVNLKVLPEYGLQLSRNEIIERYMGRSAGVVTQMIEDHLGRPLTSAERGRSAQLFTETYEAELAPIEGIIEALDQIDLPICVASGSSPEGLRWKLELCGLLDRFGEDRIFSSAQVANGKPAPDLFLFAAEQLGADPARCIVVEDSVFGVQAARAAGMRALAYVGGMLPREALEGPDTILFDDMRELPGLISASVC